MSAMLYSEILVFNNAGYSSYQQVGQIWFINRYSGSTLHRVVMRQENHQLKEIRNSQFFSVKFGGFFWDRKILIVISSFFFHRWTVWPVWPRPSALPQAIPSYDRSSVPAEIFRCLDVEISDLNIMSIIFNYVSCWMLMLSIVQWYSWYHWSIHIINKCCNTM